MVVLSKSMVFHSGILHLFLKKRYFVFQVLIEIKDNPLQVLMTIKYNVFKLVTYEHSLSNQPLRKPFPVHLGVLLLYVESPSFR